MAKQRSSLALALHSASSTAEWERVLHGSRIRFLVRNRASEGQDDCQAVSGRLVAFAVRSQSRIDVEIDRAATWPAHEPARWNRLPPAQVARFRIAALEDIATTFETLLDGRDDPDGVRTLVPRVFGDEIPPGACPYCENTPLPDQPFCERCGFRLLLAPRAPVSTPPGAGSAHCASCGCELLRGGGYCPGCGHPQHLGRAIHAVPGRVLTFAVGDGNVVSGVVLECAADESRGDVALNFLVAPDGDGAIVGRALFAARFAGPRPYSRALRALEAVGRPIAVDEVVAPCPSGDCRSSGDGSEPWPVYTLFCPDCGVRARFTPSEAASGPADVAHACGGAVVPGRDAFCGTCGESLAGFRPPSGRFERVIIPSAEPR